MYDLGRDIDVAAAIIIHWIACTMDCLMLAVRGCGAQSQQDDESMPALPLSTAANEGHGAARRVAEAYSARVEVPQAAEKAEPQQNH